MKHYEIVQKLSATGSRLEKDAIIRDALISGHMEFFIGAQLACDILVTFGVKKVPAISVDDLKPDDSGTFTFDDFLILVGKLQRREITGNAARSAIENAASSCHGPSWNDFYRRVILKDLRCGVDETTINKSIKALSKSHPEFKKFTIPVYECQLAHNGEDKVHAKKVRGKKFVDIKIDGCRLQTILDKEDGSVIQYTRNGKINNNFPGIREGFERLMASLPYSVVFDGEITAKSFQELMTQVNRKSKVDTTNAKLALFDIIPLKDFRARFCKTSQRDRHAQLVELEMSGLLREVTNGLAFVIPKIEFDLDTKEGRTAFNEFNKETLAAGYEGIMVKDPEAPYQCKRTDAWLKIKPILEVSLEIIGVEKGKPDGKRKDVMGAIVCRGEDDGKKITTNVGTGFSDEQLEDFWNRRDQLIGMIVEVQADCLTLESGSDVYSLRFPRFKGFRGSQPGEKI